MRLTSHLRETVSELIYEVKNFYYDSYSGYKKQRITYTVGIALFSVVLLAVFIKVVPDSVLTQTVSDGVSTTIDAVLPKGIAEGVKEVLGIGGNGLDSKVLYYPAPDSTSTNSVDIGGSGLVIEKPTPEETKEFYSWGVPVLGDIQAIEGDTQVVEKESPTNTPENASEAVETTINVSGRYSSWNTQHELQNIALQTTTLIQDDILLQINNESMYATWDSYVISARATLVDITALGVEIRPNMSEEVVGVWTQLEEVYVNLYSELYACESEVDLKAVALSETYRQAVELTSEFIEAVNTEREVSE